MCLRLTGWCQDSQWDVFKASSWGDQESPSTLLSFRVRRFQASLVAQWQRIRLPMQEMQVGFLGQEDPLEKEMATYSSIPRQELDMT